MSDRKHTYLFNPPQKDPKILKAEFVVRTAIFEQIFADIQSDTMQKPPQHYMLLGQRGMGKTTMLLRLKYAIEDDATLNTWLLPIVFNEEQYSMPDLASFFEHIAKLLAEDHPQYEKLLDTMRVHEYEEDYEQKAYEILVACLKENQQKIIVFHDNFGQFLEKIGKISTHRLRNILMNSSEIRLVGASATLLEHTSNYNKPFYDFFYQIRLKGMNVDETILLFERLAENEGKTAIFAEILKTERARIDVMRKLSGGVIRTMVMLFDVFIDNEKQDSFKDLEAILDRVTPLYKHRMDDLKPQQQLIVDAVAKAWDAVTVSEIAEIARADRQGLKTNQISAQLKQLVDNQIIEIEPRTKGRINLYRLQERFFNIWYLMRFARKQKNRIVWFVKFLEDSCGKERILTILGSFFEKFRNGTISDNSAYDWFNSFLMLKDEFLSTDDKLLVLGFGYMIADEKQNEEIKTFLKSKEKELTSQIDKSEESKTSIFLEPVNKSVATIIIIGLILIWLYSNNKILNQNKQEYKKLFEKYADEDLINILMYLVENKIDESLKLFNKKNIENNLSDEFLQEFFLILLSKKQYHSAYQFFSESSREANFKDRLKPIYFLTMEYLKDEYPNEYLKAGEEYRETIEELKTRVKWFEGHLN
ncbi:MULTISPECIES: hypothetical protein [unclassified Arcicella]|uniref:hypothetical protein n=1 Tax=unclassified Arcicella TaxID=2644986 RepID=UPI0028548623|nr:MULTISPECIES: hypothetical protein [unclassified Arcicella]MDR6563286.1 hypothetical protein [Arcicella sp. BE51]MDR6813293.1 hypothetical protein [Arcicella sp. BE140]MDR6824607.1 hypothetical protein [Arcicella sp. BE139]